MATEVKSYVHFHGAPSKGKIPMVDGCGYLVHDVISLGYMQQQWFNDMLENTKKLSKVNAADYDASSSAARAVGMKTEAGKIGDTTFKVAEPFSSYAIQDGNLITGQQQNSGAAAAPGRQALWPISTRR